MFIISSKSLSEIKDSFSSEAMVALGASSTFGLAVEEENGEVEGRDDEEAAALGAPGAAVSSDLNPVAMTVTLMVSSKELSNVAPQIMVASGCASLEIIEDAVSTSSRLISGEATMLIKIPVAPEMEVSSSGLVTAIFAATSALSLPVPVPTPICA